jgi:hypothetical protein
VRQTKDYAQRLQCRLAYATNGREIYQIDMLTGKEGDFNRIITIPEREKMRVAYWMGRIKPKQKTIVFAPLNTHGYGERLY